jgi:hypothetical protein
MGGDEPSLFEQLGARDLRAAILQRRNEQLEREVRLRDERILALEHQVAALQFRLGSQSKVAQVVLDVISDLVEVTNRIFPGPVTMEYGSDPEDPDHRWLLFDVVAMGAYADYRELRFQWHDEVAKLVPGSLCEFRLSIMPQR